MFRQLLKPKFFPSRNKNRSDIDTFPHENRSDFCTKIENELEKHKEKIMSRGLPKQKPIEGVKHVILVSSGKGGVGKTTTAVNLALALKRIDESKEVGILDSDVFGPSVPLLMNLNDTPNVDKNNKMIPLRNYGVKCMSMGFLVENGSPIIWRGLMVMQALQKLIREVNWGGLDYLIVDTPPGTGDTHLSLVQNVPISGVVLVTTPQKAAVDVTRRGAIMFRKLSVPLIGLVENMSHVKCTNCDEEIRIFGDCTEDLAREIDVKILCKLPLSHTISELNDKGAPVSVSEPDHFVSELYRNLAKHVVEFVNKTDGK